MDFLEALAARSADYAANDFDPSLKIIPSTKTMIVGCVDPRVDPMDILKLERGEAVVIRNVGGRINPALLETLTILRTVSKAAGQELGAGWNLIVLHHTNCGIVGCYHHAPELLATYMGVTPEDLGTLAITDPYASAAVDVAALRSNPHVPSSFTVTGLVYDVTTGNIETVVPAGPLRPDLSWAVSATFRPSSRRPFPRGSWCMPQGDCHCCYRHSRDRADPLWAVHGLIAAAR